MRDDVDTMAEGIHKMISVHMDDIANSFYLNCYDLLNAEYIYVYTYIYIYIYRH